MSESLWLQQLQPASWRGLPFAVDSSAYRRGRRTATHEYPFRDDVWVEDLGRGVRGVSFSGFVVGDDCYAQAQALLDQAEIADTGELIHPSLGSLNVTLIGPLECTERKDLGRVVELRFEFIQSGLSIYPSASADTVDVLNGYSGEADTASTGDFLDAIGAAVGEGAQVVEAGIATARAFVGTVQRVAGDASLIVGAVAGLPGNFGRFANRGRSTLLAGVVTAQAAIGTVVMARNAVSSIAANVSDLAAGL